jgi:CopG family transcriptional regulator, nickel-responsive regulator
MSHLKRFGVAMGDALLTKLDQIVRHKNYANRSAALRDLVRDQLVEAEWANPRQEVVGTLTMVYDHHARLLADKMGDIQHEHHGNIIASTHVHLDAHNCAEVVIIKGQSATIKKIADRLIATKGVKHGKLVMTSTGKELS